jgi:hypothetical protein
MGGSWGPLGGSGAPWGGLGPPGGVWGPLGGPGTPWGVLGPPGGSWDPLGGPGGVRDPPGGGPASWGEDPAPGGLDLDPPDPDRGFLPWGSEIDPRRPRITTRLSGASETSQAGSRPIPGFRWGLRTGIYPGRSLVEDLDPRRLSGERASFGRRSNNQFVIDVLPPRIGDPSPQSVWGLGFGHEPPGVPKLWLQGQPFGPPGPPPPAAV